VEKRRLIPNFSGKHPPQGDFTQKGGKSGYLVPSLRYLINFYPKKGAWHHSIKIYPEIWCLAPLRCLF
jgi:hypothetical protein